MKSFRFRAILAGLLCAVVGGNIVSAQTKPRPVATAGDKQAVLQTDHALEQALGNTDKTVAKELATKLLDADFTWTDADGKTSARAQFLQKFDAENTPAFAVGGKNAEVTAYAYGQVGVVQANVGKMHILRVWVKHQARWRALVYQEVRSLDTPPTSTPGPGKVCENPCKRVPFQPKNDAEKGVIESYMGLETAALAHSASDWSSHVADEFAAASSNSDELLDKPGRIKGLEREKMAGVSPTALVSARMFDFGDTVVMTSRHQPDKGKPLHITRVWVMRDGKWLETLSYQTAIQ
jgi:hypothetical protein